MLTVECGERHRAEREYALTALLGDALGLDHRIATGEDGVVVIRDDTGRRLVVADVFFASNDDLLDQRALPNTPLATCARETFSGAAAAR